MGTQLHHLGVHAAWFVGVLTACASSYAAVVGFPGLMFNTSMPLQCPPNNCCVSCFGCVCPCNWSPSHLLAANILGSWFSGVSFAISIFLWLIHRDVFIAVVGIGCNAFGTLLCLAASFMLYQPQYRIKKALELFENDFFDGGQDDDNEDSKADVENPSRNKSWFGARG